MTAATATVESALDQYVAAMKKRKVDPYSVRCATLAQIAGVYREDMSLYLQEYRFAQKDNPKKPKSKKTRYVIACSGYGPGATWRILSKPGDDPRLVQRARKKATTYAIDDSVKRYAKRIVHEVSPATSRHNQAVDTAVNALIPLVEAQLTAVAQYVEVVMASVHV